MVMMGRFDFRIRLRFWLLTLLAALSLAACGNSEEGGVEQATGAETPSETVSNAAPPAAEDAVWPQDASNVPVDPAVTFGRLETGLRYAILPNETPKNAVSMRLYVGAGSLSERDDQQGVAHFLEHMAFKGSESMPGDEVVKFLERLGLAFGPDTNAFTSFDQTVYQLELPEANDDLITEGLSIFREYAGRLTLDGEAIDKERGVILSEMRVRNSPQFRRSKALYSFLLPDHLVTRRFPIGTEEVIKTAPRQAFVDFYEDYYRPENMILVVVGEVDPAVIETRIRDLFRDFVRDGEGGVEPELQAVSHEAMRAGHFSDPDLATQVQIFAVAPRPAATDTVARRERDLLIALGNAILSRRISALARQEEAVFVGGGAGVSDFLDMARFAVVSLTTTPEQWQATLAVAEQELRRALEHGFNQAELTEQLANFESSLVDAADAAPTRKSNALAAGILGTLHEDRVFTTPQTELALFRTSVESLSVEDVTAAFRAAWADLPMQVFVSGPLDLETPEETILAALEQSRSVAVAPLEEAGAEQFAYTDFGPPGDVVSRERVEDLDIELVRFANNVHLNIKQTDFQAETIQISVRLSGGLISQPKDKPGLDILTDQVMVSGGLEAHSLDDIVRLFAGASVELDFSVDADAFTYAAGTDPTDLDKQLNLLAALITAPGYRPEALARFKKSADILYETIDATPGGVAQRDAPRIVRSNDPRFGLPPRDKLDLLTLDDVQAWIGPALANAHLEIGVVGDVAPDRVIEAVARTFGALPPRAAEPEGFDDGREVAFPEDSVEPVTLRHAGEPDQAMAQLYWQTTDARDRVLARRLSVLASVMRLKLTEIARRQEGVTYSPRVNAVQGTVFPGYGYIVSSLDLVPDDTAPYLETMADVAASIVEEGITDDEFLRAKKPIVESVEEQLERNVYWLSAVVDVAQSQPDRLEAARSILDDYKTMTKADVEEVAKAYLGGKTVEIVVLPADGQDTENGSQNEATEE